MGETDVTFRRLLRGLPGPILQLAFPDRRLEPFGPPLDPSLDRSRPQLLYLVTAVMLGSETAKRVFHMESIIQDPNVQELIREWEDKGRVEGRVEGRAEEDVRTRIDGEPDVTRLEAWLEAAVNAGAIGDVFRDG